MAIRGSAAWVITVVVITGFIVGALLFTVTDPIAQALFDSAMWQSSTSYGTNTLSWGKSLWSYLSVFVLIGFLSLVWVTTRRSG